MRWTLNGKYYPLERSRHDFTHKHHTETHYNYTEFASSFMNYIPISSDWLLKKNYMSEKYDRWCETWYREHSRFCEKYCIAAHGWIMEWVPPSKWNCKSYVSVVRYHCFIVVIDIHRFQIQNEFIVKEITIIDELWTSFPNLLFNLDSYIMKTKTN